MAFFLQNTSTKNDQAFNNTKTANSLRSPVYPNTLLPVPGSTYAVQGNIAFQKDAVSPSTTGTLVFYDGTAWIDTLFFPLVLAPVGNAPNANAATLVGPILNLEPASATQPGVLTAGPALQQIGGDKQFMGAISASNLSGTNTGDVTLAAFGAAPNANAASLAGQQLTLQPASATQPGGVSTTTQSFLGNKTFVNQIIGQQNVTLPDTTSATVGNLFIGDMRLHNYSPFGAGVKNIFLGETAGNYTNTGSLNIGVGTDALRLLTTGSSNIVLGHGTSSITTGTFNSLMNAGSSVTTGSGNVAAGRNCLGSLTTGSDNVCIGRQTGNNMLTGSSNVIIGKNTGIGYVGAETDNLVIGAPGVAADIGRIRIGTAGLHIQGTFVTGIEGVVPAAYDSFVVSNASDQIGSIPQASLPGNYGDSLFYFLGGQVIPAGGAFTQITFDPAAPYPANGYFLVNAPTYNAVTVLQTGFIMARTPAFIENGAGTPRDWVIALRINGAPVTKIYQYTGAQVTSDLIISATMTWSVTAGDIITIWVASTQGGAIIASPAGSGAAGSLHLDYFRNGPTFP